MSKKVLTLIAVLNVFLCNLLEVNVANAQKVEDYDIYSELAIVTAIDTDTWTVYCTDSVGNIWAFECDDEWWEGDFALLTMWNNATPEICEDDVIIFASYVDPKLVQRRVYGNN